MKDKFRKVNGGIIVLRGGKEIFVPDEHIRPNGKLKQSGKQFIEREMQTKKS